MARAMLLVQATLVLGCVGAPPAGPPVVAAASEDDEGAVSMLQLAAKITEHHSGDSPTAAQQPGSTEQLGSLVPDNGHVCYQGTMENLGQQLALLRSSPVAVMHQRNSVQTQTCAERGYGFLRHDPDDCWIWNQKWLREEHGNQELDVWGSAQGLEWRRFDALHGFPMFTSMDWCGCLCPVGSSVRTTPRFTDAYCSALLASYGQAAARIASPAAIPAVAAPAPASSPPEEQLGSLVPDNGHVCYQGTMANLERQLALLRSSPVAALHQGNSVQTQTCAERGYGFLRHDPDDCWVWNQKWLREQTGDAELDLWAAVQGFTWLAWDARHGYPIGTAMEWCGCICPVGSSVRTTPRFTEAYCSAFLASYGQATDRIASLALP